MNPTTQLHNDVLVTILNGLIQQLADGQISYKQFYLESEPIRTEISDRIRQEINLISQQLNHTSKKKDSIYEGAKAIAEAFQKEKAKHKTEVADYEEFLEMKGLDLEFDDWQIERIRKRMKEGK